MNSGVNVKDVQLLFVHFVPIYDEFNSIYDDIWMLHTDKDRQDYIQVWFKHNTKHLNEFKHNVCTWLASTKAEDTISLKCRSKSGIIIKSIISTKLKEEQRSAELATRTEALNKKKKLEQAKLKIQQE